MTYVIYISFDVDGPGLFFFVEVLIYTIKRYNIHLRAKRDHSPVMICTVLCRVYLQRAAL